MNKCGDVMSTIQDSRFHIGGGHFEYSYMYIYCQFQQYKVKLCFTL